MDQSESNTTVVQYYLCMQLQSAKTPLSEDEKKNINSNKGRTAALGKDIASVFGVSPQNIEVGQSVVQININGSKTLIVQSINNNKNTPSFIDDQYNSSKKEINDVFRKHFELTDKFVVKCHPNRRYPQFNKLQRVNTV